MSQQEMQFEGSSRHEPNHSYTGYEGVPHYNNYSTASYGQKLTPQAAFSSGQRLALAIISIVMLMIMTFGLIGIAIATRVPDWAVIPILFILTLFYAAVVIINIVSNRKH